MLRTLIWTGFGRALSTALLLFGVVSFSSAQTPFTVTASQYLDSYDYEYSPSWMADDTVGKDRIWWCAANGTAGAPAPGDAIRYTEGGGVTETVMTAQGGWEGLCVCDPAVVRGSFPYGGSTYSHAMYYTAAACSPNAPASANSNRIGVAFSHDGKVWTKHASNPLFETQFTDPDRYTRYGAGQAQVRNYNGGAGVQMWHTDSPPEAPTRVYERISVDGINFSAPQPLSNSGITGTAMASAGIALSPGAPWELYLVNGSDAGMQVFKIPYDQRFYGTWTLLGTINGGALGSGTRVIFEAGFRTDIYGNLSNTTFPGVFVGSGCGDDYPNPRAQWRLCQAGMTVP
jgi:hypothetical protein